jgi:hypothetical protein
MRGGRTRPPRIRSRSATGSPSRSRFQVPATPSLPSRHGVAEELSSEDSIFGSPVTKSLGSMLVLYECHQAHKTDCPCLRSPCASILLVPSLRAFLVDALERRDPRDWLGPAPVEAHARGHHEREVGSFESPQRVSILTALSDTPGVVHIVRSDRLAVQSTTTEFSVSFGGHKDGVGTIELGRPKGFDALTALLRKLSVALTEIEIACQVLTTAPRHEISNVILRRGIFRHLGL